MGFFPKPGATSMPIGYTCPASLEQWARSADSQSLAAGNSSQAEDSHTLDSLAADRYRVAATPAAYIQVDWQQAGTLAD